MTFVITVILGAGIVLIASALDNSSIFDTVVKMTQNQPINWSGKAPASSANSNTASGAGSAGTF